MNIADIYTSMLSNSLPIIDVLNVLIHIFCGLGIAKDIPKILETRIDTILLPRNIWILTGLICGIWGILIYWILHHSNTSNKF